MVLRALSSRKAIAATILMIILLVPSVGYSADTKPPPDDGWIISASKILMEQDGQLDPAEIQIESKNGKAVLRGAVMTEFEKARAEHILTAVPGSAHQMAGRSHQASLARADPVVEHRPAGVTTTTASAIKIPV